MGTFGVPKFARKVFADTMGELIICVYNTGFVVSYMYVIAIEPSPHELRPCSTGPLATLLTR